MWSGSWKSWGEAVMMLIIRDGHVPTTSRCASNKLAVGCNFEVLQDLGAEWTREDSGGQLVPDGDNCVRVGLTQVVSGTDWKFIGQLVCMSITSLECTTGGVTVRCWGCWGGSILCRRGCASGQCILYRRQSAATIRQRARLGSQCIGAMARMAWACTRSSLAR